MPGSEVLSERRGQALVVTFNRPDKANAMNMDMANQVFTILKNATTDHSVRAVLLRGAGENFMKGVDLENYVQDMNMALERANQLILPYHSAIREIQAMDKPVLAAVHGGVAGAGFSFMLACDLVLSAETALFNARFAQYAASPDGGASYYLPRKVGLSRAVEIMMFCEDFSAARAEKLSLVNKVVPDDQLEQAAYEWLDKLVAGPTKAYGAIKKLACKAFEQDLHAHLGLEHTYHGHSTRSFDFREGVRARAAGRDPKFTGT